MTNQYTIEAVKQKQEELSRTIELQNIQGLQRKVNDAKRELAIAQLKRHNRMMA